MIEKFLRAKHWQLFTLTFGIPMLFQIVLFVKMYWGLSNGNNPSIDFMFDYFKVFPILMLVFMFILYGWFWSVGIGLDKMIPDDLKLKVKRFKLFLIFPLVYISLFGALMYISFNGLFRQFNPLDNPSIFASIIPLHLFAMFCMMYCLYFVAKTIKTVELQKKVGFEDFAGEFVLIWLFPIGVWIVQPKINKMIEQWSRGEEIESNDSPYSIDF